MNRKKLNLIQQKALTEYFINMKKNKITFWLLMLLLIACDFHAIQQNCDWIKLILTNVLAIAFTYELIFRWFVPVKNHFLGLIYILILLLSSSLSACQERAIPFKKSEIVMTEVPVPFDDFKDTTATFVRYEAASGEVVGFMFYTGENIPDTVFVEPELRKEFQQ